MNAMLLACVLASAAPSSAQLPVQAAAPPPVGVSRPIDLGPLEVQITNLKARVRVLLVHARQLEERAQRLRQADPDQWLREQVLLGTIQGTVEDIQRAVTYLEGLRPPSPQPHPPGEAGGAPKR